MTERYGDLPTQATNNPFRSKYEGLSLIELHSLKVSAEASRAQFREDSSLYVRTTSLISALDELITEQIVDVADDFMSNHLLNSPGKRAQVDLDHTTIISSIPRTAPRVSLMDASINDGFAATPDVLDQSTDQASDSCKIAHNGEVISLKAMNFPPEKWLTILERSRQDAQAVHTIEHSGALALPSERDLLQRALAANKNPDILRQEEADEHARQETARAAERLIVAQPPSIPPKSKAPPAQSVYGPNGETTDMPSDSSAPSDIGEHGLAKTLNKKGWINRRTVTVSAAVGLLAVGGAVGVGSKLLNKEPAPDAAAQANTVVTQQDKAKMAPAMTSKDFKVGLCINEAPLIQGGNVNGQAQAVPVFEGTDKVQHKIGTIDADGAINSIPVTIETAPVSVAACAPKAVRAALVTMKDGVVTFDRKDVTLQVLLGQGMPAMPDVQFKASPAKMLDAVTAKTLQDSFNKDTTQQDLGTLAQSEIANAIVAKDSALLTSTVANSDAATKVNLQNQITDYYTSLNQKVPSFKIDLVGTYAAVVAVQPKGLDGIVKRNVHFEVTNGKVVKLSFPDITQEGKK